MRRVHAVPIKPVHQLLLARAFLSHPSRQAFPEQVEPHILAKFLQVIECRINVDVASLDLVSVGFSFHLDGSDSRFSVSLEEVAFLYCVHVTENVLNAWVILPDLFEVGVGYRGFFRGSLLAYQEPCVEIVAFNPKVLAFELYILVDSFAEHPT